MSKILIIEDDPFVRKFYERLFSFEDHQIFYAESGNAGILKSRELKPDLILLDIILPDIDGLVVLKTIKEDPATAHIIVVMLTNLEDDKTVRKASELKADGFIIKSNIAPEKLSQEVDRYLSTKY